LEVYFILFLNLKLPNKAVAVVHVANAVVAAMATTTTISNPMAAKHAREDIDIAMAMDAERSE
jgi:hypothetical protein